MSRQDRRRFRCQVVHPAARMLSPEGRFDHEGTVRVIDQVLSRDETARHEVAVFNDPALQLAHHNRFESGIKAMVNTVSTEFSQEPVAFVDADCFVTDSSWFLTAHYKVVTRR